MCAASAARPAFTAAAAAPNAAIAATFSVPARLPRSCPPPRISGSGSAATSSRLISAPAPLAPPILCALSVSRSAPSASMSSAHAARRLHGIDMQQPAVPMHDLGRLRATGWITPVSLFAAMSETSARCRQALQAAAASAARSTTPSRVDRNLLDRRAARTARPHSTEGCSIAETSRRSNGASRARSSSGVSASAFASVPPEVKIDVARDRRRPAPRPARAPASTSCARRAALAMDRGRIAGQRPAPRTGLRAPRHAAAHSHSSPDRRARPLILDPPSPHSSAHYPKDLLLAPEIVQKKPATPARLCRGFTWRGCPIN